MLEPAVLVVSTIMPIAILAADIAKKMVVPEAREYAICKAGKCVGIFRPG